MKSQSLNIFKKGNFLPIDECFIVEGLLSLQNVADVQKKYKKLDTDTFINELRDSIVGRILGYDLINNDKHGFDCKKVSSNEYLEVKQASAMAKTWNATFNDTTLEKAEAFKDRKLYLALAIWGTASELLFMVYGQNDKIGEFLAEKVKHFKNGNTVRSTQSISYTKLIKDYGFKIIINSKSKEDIYNIITLKNPTMKKIIKITDIMHISEI